MKKMNLEELTKKINEILNNELIKSTSDDSRYSQVLSERRIRDFVTKGMIKKPIKEGRNVFYNEDHIKQILEIRTLQSKGLTDKSILNIKTEYQVLENENTEVEEDLKESIFQDLKNIETRNEKEIKNYISGKTGTLISSLNKSGISTDSIRSIVSNAGCNPDDFNSAPKLNSIYKKNIEPESWDEYMLSDNLIIKIKQKQNLSDEEIKQAIEDFKIILNNK